MPDQVRNDAWGWTLRNQLNMQVHQVVTGSTGFNVVTEFKKEVVAVVV